VQHRTLILRASRERARWTASTEGMEVNVSFSDAPPRNGMGAGILGPRWHAVIR